MLKQLLDTFSGRKQVIVAPSATPTAAPPPRRPAQPGTPMYPPVDQGVAVVTVEQLLESQQDLIRRIKLLAGTDDADFNQRYLSVIKRLAHYIQLLPASETDTHNGAGGLFRLCLELAFFSSQAAESLVFSGRGTAEDRRREEPRWRYATFLAGICCELHRCISGMAVVSPTGNVWPACNIPLTAWAEQGKFDHYHVRWAKSPAGMATASLLVEKIVTAANLQYLLDGSSRIVPALMDVIAGVRSIDRSMLADLIEKTRDKVLSRDKGIQPANYGRMSVGSHLEPHLLDAMRQLIQSGKWQVNQRKSRLWYSEQGLFLVWRMAAKEMIGQLAQNNVGGVPQDAQTLLEILDAAKVFAKDKDGSPYWMIIPPGETTEIAAVKFANPMTVFGGALDEITPIDNLDGGQDAKEAGQAKAQSAAQAQSAEPPPVSAAANPQQEHAGSETPRPKVKPGAPISEMDANDSNATVPKAIAATLRPAIREVMNALLAECRTGKVGNKVAHLENGFAIEVEYLLSFGASIEDILKNLQEAGWLYSPPEKPSKKLHQVVIGNNKVNAIIIKPALARDAGFVKA